MDSSHPVNQLLHSLHPELQDVLLSLAEVLQQEQMLGFHQALYLIEAL